MLQGWTKQSALAPTFSASTRTGGTLDRTTRLVDAAEVVFPPRRVSNQTTSDEGMWQTRGRILRDGAELSTRAIISLTRHFQLGLEGRRRASCCHQFCRLTAPKRLVRASSTKCIACLCCPCLGKPQGRSVPTRNTSGISASRL